jgi:hypothetical protein
MSSNGQSVVRFHPYSQNQHNIQNENKIKVSTTRVKPSSSVSATAVVANKAPLANRTNQQFTFKAKNDFNKAVDSESSLKKTAKTQATPTKKTVLYPQTKTSKPAIMNNNDKYEYNYYLNNNCKFFCFELSLIFMQMFFLFDVHLSKSNQLSHS